MLWAKIINVITELCIGCLQYPYKPELTKPLLSEFVYFGNSIYWPLIILFIGKGLKISPPSLSIARTRKIVEMTVKMILIAKGVVNNIVVLSDTGWAYSKIAK